MPDNPFDALVDAFEEAKNQMRETTRQVKAQVVRPANPNAVQPTRQERIAELDLFLSDPNLRESEFLRLKDRFKVPDGQIPRRLVDYIRYGQAEKRKAIKQREG